MYNLCILISVSFLFHLNIDSINGATIDQLVADDVNLNITELVRKYKYGFEEHEVITEDGYILKIHRILPKNLGNSSVVFLMHGILDSSDSWVLQGPDSLPYILVNNGFDVWMGNARGNKHSNLHTTMTKNESDFWKFTWEEIGVYDLPAMIDYILNVSMKDSLYYVGHSQGTTSFFVMNSLKLEYISKIRMMFALAPIAWLSHAKSPVVKYLANLEYFLNINAYASSTETFSVLEKLCFYIPGCGNILQNIIGKDNAFINKSLIPIIKSHVPSTSSTLQFVHYCQLYLSGNFSRFDYGLNGNLIKYGEEIPPLYNLRNMTVPMVLFYSGNDWLSDVKDVSILYNKLPNVYNTYLVNDFNHLDYMYAAIAKISIYSNIIKEIHEFENEIYEYSSNVD